MGRVESVPTMGMPRAQSQDRVSGLLCIIYRVLYKLMMFQSERMDFWQTTPSCCKKHTNLCKYWSKWRRCFLGFSKYSCQGYGKVLAQLLRSGSTWVFLKWCAWPLNLTSDAWCLCQKDGGTLRKKQKICSFGPGILCCFAIVAVPGT